jgi:UDP-N-acetylglucosamine acyltransferase
MSSEIHPTSIVSPHAEIGDDVRIGPYCRVERGVKIGDGCVLESHAFIDQNTTLGKDNYVGHGVVLGTPPQDKKFDLNSQTGLLIGDDNTFREYCTVNRATGNDANTVIGSGNMIMTMSHVGHNCYIGDETVISNVVTLAGHVQVHDWAILGGAVPVPQFTRFGKGTYMGGFSAIRMDLPPFFRAAGNPGGPAGINRVGMKRRGIPDESIRAVHRAYKTLYFSKLSEDEALNRIVEESGEIEEIRILVEFIRESKIGIVRPRSDRGIV